jgi:hypothetical protein
MIEKLENKPELRVWVEPVDLRDENDIVQLDITTKNYVDGVEVSGTRAVSAIEADCTSLHLMALNAC